MTNDKLPEEITEQINDQAEVYANKYLNGKVNTHEFQLLEDGWQAGATAWAPWFVKHNAIESELHGVRAENDRLKESNQELKDNGQRMADALEIIANSPVPANEREMVSWILTARALAVEQLQQFKDGMGKEAEQKPEGWPFVCHVCGKQDCESDHK